jgi:Peptidase family M50
MSFLSIFTTVLWWALVGFVAGTIAHETGHCAAAALASLPIRRVRIGTGEVWLRTRLGAAELELRMMPLGGFVWIAAGRTTSRPRLVAFMLGGIAANAALLGVTIWLWRSVPGLPEDPLAGFAIAQVSLIAGSLIPLWGRAFGIRFANDAMQVLLLLRGRHSLDVHLTYEDLLAHYAPGRVPRMTEASRVLREHITGGGYWYDRNARRRLLDAAQAELGGTVISPEERLLILNVLISTALASRDPAFCGNLHDWTRRIAELDPDGALTTGTRGVVLVELGRFAAGKAILDTLAKTDVDSSDPFEACDQIVIQAFIARAEGALGEARAGRRRLVDVRRAIGANSAYEWLRPLVERIDRELIAGRYDSPAAAAVPAGAPGTSTAS